MKVIPASKNDIAWIIELENHPENNTFVWQGSYEEHLAEIEDPNHYLLIHLNEQDEPVGYSLNRFCERSRIFELRRIVIERKGQGYGRKAILSLLHFAFLELGVQRFWLDVYPHNHVGVSLYKSLGFIQEAHLRRSDYQRGEFFDQLIFSMLKEEYEKIYR